jgi:hypothetical protein
MYFDPRALFMSAVLVAVTGWVLRGLMTSWFKLRREGAAAPQLEEMEDRLRKIESTTTSLLIEVQTMREKERFMAKLQASATTRQIAAKTEPAAADSDSPLHTQSIPVIPRATLSR